MRVTPGARALGIVLAAALLAAGCTGEANEAAGPGGGSCPSENPRFRSDVPENAVRVTEVTGDLDGEGAPDRAVTFGIEEGGSTLFYLRLITDGGWIAQAPLDRVDPTLDVRPLGTARIGSDREVVFVFESGPKAARIVSIWGLHDLPDRPCALRRVELDLLDGERFRVGGSEASGAGLACREVEEGPALILTLAHRTPEGTWEWVEEAWIWPGAGKLRRVSESSGTVDTRKEASRYFQFDCPGVEAP